MSHPLTEETLKAAGFQTWDDTMSSQSACHLSSWQKRVDGKYGKHYFINIKLNDFDLDFPAQKLGRRWEADAQMITLDSIDEDDSDSFNISLFFRPTMTLAHVEHFFAKTWESMNARADEYSRENEETHMRERKAKVATQQEHKLRVITKPKI